MDRTPTATETTQGGAAPARKTAQTSQKAIRVPVRLAQRGTLMDRIREMQDRVTRRAFELFRENGEQEGRDLDDWFAAEQELFWKPAFDLKEEDGVFTVRADVAGMAPGELEVTATTDRLVLTGERHHEHHETRGEVHYSEFSQGSLYREIAFPRPVDASAVKATLRHGLLEITAPALPEAPEVEATESGDAPGGRRTIEIAEA